MTKKQQDDLRKEPVEGYNVWQSLSIEDAAKSKQSKNAKEGAAKAKSYRRVRLEGTFWHDDRVLVGLTTMR